MPRAKGGGRVKEEPERAGIFRRAQFLLSSPGGEFYFPLVSSSRWISRSRRCWIVAALCAVALAGLGRAGAKAPREGLVEEAIEEKNPERSSQAQLQMQVMDFSDQYTSAMWAALDDYLARETDPAKRVLAQKWKVTFGSAAMEIAASGDPRLNLLDMAVFISAGKWAVETYWIPQVFGGQAAGLRLVYAEMDRKIWAMVDERLTVKQRQDLRRLIAEWKRQNPAMHEVADVRLRNLEGVRLADFDETMTAKGLLASVRKLLGRVDTSLLYGERMMFYIERSPRILSQETDFTLYRIAQEFPLAAVRPPDFTQLSATLQQWPALLQAGLDRNRDLLREIAPQVRSGIDRADHFAMTLDGTMQSLQKLSDSLQVTLDSARALGNPADTLRQTDATLVHLDSALKHLDASVSGVNQLLAQDASGQFRVAALSQALNFQAERLMDQAFRKALLLLAAFFGGIILILIATRLLFGPRRPAPPRS